jgi:hypothetical protein
MRTFLIAFGVIALSSAAVAAQEPCPAHSTARLPWAIDELMSGDRYADVYLDINEQGRPTACRMGRNNLLGDDKFWVCRAFMEQWSTKGGPTGRITVKRQWIEYGMKHSDAEGRARNKYFKDHPHELSECYPKDASTGRTIREPTPIGAAYAH